MWNGNNRMKYNTLFNLMAMAIFLFIFLFIFHLFFALDRNLLKFAGMSAQNTPISPWSKNFKKFVVMNSSKIHHCILDQDFLCGDEYTRPVRPKPKCSEICEYTYN